MNLSIPKFREGCFFVYVNSNYSMNSSLNVEDVILTRSINLYPNPVTDVLTIDSEIPLTNVEVYSVLGEKVKEMDSDFKSLSMNNLVSFINEHINYSENKTKIQREN